MPSITAAQYKLEQEMPLAQRLTIRYHEACVFTGLPETKLNALMASGLVKSAKIGRTRLVDVKSLIRAITKAQDEPITFEMENSLAGNPVSTKRIVRRARRGAA